MKFTVDTLTFVNITKKVIKGFVPKDEHAQTLLRIVTKDNTNLLEIQATSQTTLFRGTIPLYNLEEEPKDDKEWSVDGVQLKTILSILPTNSGSLTFEMNYKKRQFVLKVTGNTLNLPVYDSVKYIPEEQTSVISTVDGQDFIRNISSLSKVLLSDSTHQDSPHSCVNIIFTEDVMKMMGANRQVLVEIKQNHQKRSQLPTSPVLINSHQISLLSQSFNVNTIIDLVVTEHKFGYVDENNILYLVAKSNLMAIPYEHLKNQVSYEENVIIDSLSFKYVIDSLSKLDSLNKSEQSKNIEFTLSENGMQAKNSNGDVMNVTTEEINSENTTLSFVKTSLPVMLGLLPEKVKLSWKKNSTFKFVKFTLLDSNNIEVDDTFIMVVTNNV